MLTHRKSRKYSDFAPDAWRNVMQTGDFGTQNRVLTSWKEIAAYLGKGVRTVQRWEKDFALPVRRPRNSDKSAILARTCDLDAWVAMRCSTRTPSGEAADHGHQLLSLRSTLAAGLTTALMLRHSNAALISEVRKAICDLHTRLDRLSRSPAAAPPSAPEPMLPAPDGQSATGAA